MNTKVVETKLVSVDVSGLVAGTISIQRPYTMHKTGSLIPERVDLRWEREDYGEWVMVRASVSGVRMKLSGEPGIAQATSWFITHSRREQPFPDWLDELVRDWGPPTDPWPQS